MRSGTARSPAGLVGQLWPALDENCLASPLPTPLVTPQSCGRGCRGRMEAPDGGGRMEEHSYGTLRMFPSQK